MKHFAKFFTGITILLMVLLISISCFRIEMFALPLLMASLLDDDRLTLSQVAKLLKVNTSTVWRWALHGVRNVKLVTYSVGAKRYTNEKNVDQFIKATTAAAGPQSSETLNRSCRQRQRDIETSETYLDSQSI